MNYSEVSGKGNDPAWLRRISLSVLQEVEVEVHDKREGDWQVRYNVYIWSKKKCRSEQEQ